MGEKDEMMMAEEYDDLWKVLTVMVPNGAVCVSYEDKTPNEPSGKWMLW